MISANRAIISSFQNDRMIILFEVLNDEQYRDYLDQRLLIHKDIKNRYFKL